MQPAALPPSPPPYATPSSTFPHKEHPQWGAGEPHRDISSKSWLSPRLAVSEPHLPPSQVKHLNMSKDFTGWRKGLGATPATARLSSWLLQARQDGLDPGSSSGSFPFPYLSYPSSLGFHCLFSCFLTPVPCLGRHPTAGTGDTPLPYLV